MLIDSHCHLDAPAFEVDRAAVRARARQAGVTYQIIPATVATGWEGLRRLCLNQTDLYPAYGLHPMFLAQHRDSDLLLLRQWLERERPVAVGECGLDFFVTGLDIPTQQHFFQAQLRLAREFDLPVILHARRAVDAVIAAIRRIGPLRGVVHSFSGSAQQAQQLWQAGFLLGLGGPLTYPRAQRLRQLAARLPLEALLLETDAPDQPDAAISGQRNEPARLAFICQTLAELRGTSEQEIADATSANARRLFRLPA